MKIRQNQLARELALSAMTISRRLRALDRINKHLTEFDALAVLASQELDDALIPGHEAIQMLADFASELRWLTADASRRCWLVFHHSNRARFSAAAITESHLQSVLAAFPMSRVLPLHDLVSRARQRLTTMTERNRQMEAA